MANDVIMMSKRKYTRQNLKRKCWKRKLTNWQKVKKVKQQSENMRPKKRKYDGIMISY